MGLFRLNVTMTDLHRGECGGVLATLEMEVVPTLLVDQ